MLKQPGLSGIWYTWFGSFTGPGKSFAWQRANLEQIMIAFWYLTDQVVIALWCRTVDLVSRLGLLHMQKVKILLQGLTKYPADDFKLLQTLRSNSSHLAMTEKSFDSAFQGCQIHQKQRASMESWLWVFCIQMHKSLFADATYIWIGTSLFLGHAGFQTLQMQASALQWHSET